MKIAKIIHWTIRLAFLFFVVIYWEHDSESGRAITFVLVLIWFALLDTVEFWSETIIRIVEAATEFLKAKLERDGP